MSRAWIIFMAGIFSLVSAVGRADEREITVFAAASLRGVFEELGTKVQGSTIRFSFAGSQELRAQIEGGAKPDLVAFADTKQAAVLQKAGLVKTPRIFARNRLVVVVPASNPAGITRFAELPKARRLVIGAAEVPVGAYTLEILEKSGIRFKDEVLARVVSRELNVKQVLAKVTLGEADAAVVYATDAIAAGDKIIALAIPADVAVTADYSAAILATASNPVGAQRFLDLLLSVDGQARLAAAGFEHR